ncbi:acetoin utilization protein AcuB [Tumebacillus algifaecis]|uniref:Acetoin utilization protein AcuB n=1 Tax=Tumebacillus algifaecis TaxID=1214604 RepID=A0A223CZT5_9BACL|nr:CBS and ACT domain-containing protein [Tumebacillus algifaecis]ASS74868.1 acetoin utilization protein AcuB [Tumebacillus algifaecis]
MLVEQIMTREVVTLSPDNTLQEALDLSHHHRLRHLPVVQDGLLVGLISDRDLRAAAPSTLEQAESDQILHDIRVEQLMIKDVITAHPLDFVEDAAAQIYKHSVGCLPVVSQGKLTGIVTERDILRNLVEMMGVNAPTSRIEVEVPDKTGMLANISDLLRARRINTSAVMVFPSAKEGYRTIVFRIRTMDPRRFIQDIEAAGYRVVGHPSMMTDGEV